ncbi:hypothetical protein MMN25_06210 [Helicobacter pylori]|uniref:hypothetical protein n=1 Tax=Helicobacter pylori TaxID=210 RepID=UPI0030C08872
MRQKHETATSFNQLSEITQIMQALKPKAKARAKNYALNPTKKAFSERQITTIRDNSHASAKKKHANAFKSDEANTRGQK